MKPATVRESACQREPPASRPEVSKRSPATVMNAWPGVGVDRHPAPGAGPAEARQRGGVHRAVDEPGRGQREGDRARAVVGAVDERLVGQAPVAAAVDVGLARDRVGGVDDGRHTRRRGRRDRGQASGPSPAASIARPARDPKACSSSRRTWASVGAPRPLAEPVWPAFRDAGFEAAPDAPAACPAAVWREGSGGGMYGGPVRHSAIWCISPEPQPAAARAAMQKAIVTPRRTRSSMAAHKGVRALTHIRPARG